MRKFKRLDAPDFLIEKWEEWGKEWERRHSENNRASFYWHQVDNEAVNHKLLPTLKAQTQDHCSFCDNYPVSPPSVDTIEHFRPKTTHPSLAYQWENLYYCCVYCQGAKQEKFDEALLRPDAIDYDFDRFFRWDFTRGPLEVNERAADEDKKRAQVTIELYRLNDRHPSLRLREQHKRSKAKDDPIDDFAYRSFVEDL